VEFTVEPFVDAHPGAHVQAAWAAVEARGLELIQGPFSAESDVDMAEAPELVADVVRAALGGGATHVSFLIDRREGDGDQ
jgi:uncharacterized protein YqgV (UPF0045/DUF77 family)